MLLNKGHVIKNKHENMELEEYRMELLGKDRLREVIELQQHVYDKLPNKDVLYMDSYYEMLEDMDSGAKIIGVQNENNRIIAYRYIGFPGKNKRNLGYDINLAEEEMDKVVHLETTVVDPLYRGNNLQSLTLEAAKQMVMKDGYEHFLCTVSPHNFYSLYNIMKNGLMIKALKKKYGSTEVGDDGLWRFILHSDIKKQSILNPIDLVLSKWANLDMQKDLINQGYIGYELNKDSRVLNYIKFE
ncbi:MAG: GNAT family N-acetyltransferase [Gudongella sp.]|nr:GNAT family N-acetyltransferase [Gudongella sp.]